MPRARGASAASSGNSRPRTTHKLPSSAQLDARRSRLYRGVRNRCGHRGGRPGRTDSGGPAHLAAEPQSDRRRLDIARQQPEPRQQHPSNARGGRALGRACLARTLLALATRATSEAEAWLVAPSGEVLESEESTMLCEVCELLGRLERNGSLRGHIASGLIDLVRAFTWPLTLAAALLRWRDLTPCKIRATSRPPPRAVARLQATPSSSPGRSGQDLSKFGKKSKTKAIICFCLEVREFITQDTQLITNTTRGVFLQSDLRNALLLAYGWLRPRFDEGACSRVRDSLSPSRDLFLSFSFLR